MKRADIPIGYEFGTRVVVANVGQVRPGQYCWRVRCLRCQTEVDLRSAEIRRRVTCMQCRKRRQASPTYKSWTSMRVRCLCRTANNYAPYGGRGIRICDRWLESFENFLADMGERPEGTTLDRIDNDGNYEPGNCRWATVAEQNRNKSTTKLTPMLARSIRMMHELGYSQSFVGRRFGVAKSLVCQIAQGKIWRAA